MAVVKHYSIKNSPLALLKYITGETKSQKAEIVTGINCSVDPKSAYLEMSLCYESFAGEKFHRTKKPEGKEHIKIHHYVFSFKGKEVTPQAANRIVQEWAKKFSAIIVRYLLPSTPTRIIFTFTLPLMLTV